MSIQFPTNPDELINAIEEDAPAVYDILRECYFQEIWEWSAPPTSEELMEQLENYWWDNFDTHYWNWRWSIMRELINPDACDGDNGTLHIAELMNDLTRTHYGYALIRCESCDRPHRLQNSIEYPTQYECDESWSTPTKHCQCWQPLNHDHPDLFY